MEQGPIITRRRWWGSVFWTMEAAAAREERTVWRELGVCMSNLSDSVLISGVSRVGSRGVKAVE